MFKILKDLFGSAPDINSIWGDSDEHIATIVNNCGECSIVCEVPADLAITILRHMNKRFPNEQFHLTNKQEKLYLTILNKNSKIASRYEELVAMFIAGRSSNESEI